MARKVLDMDNVIVKNGFDDEDGAEEANCETEMASEFVIVNGDEAESEHLEEDVSATLNSLLNQVNVGEESYKTSNIGKSNVAISVEIEEVGTVDVSPLPPAVGMVFGSWQEVDKYFRDYGRQEGFGVVRSSAATVGKGVNARDKRNVTWHCECFGMPVQKGKKIGPCFVSDSQIAEEVCVKRKSKKVDCPVELKEKVNKVGVWEIHRVELNHSGHNPTPGKSKNITKFRKKYLVENPHVVRQLFNDRKAGVPVSTIYNCMAKQRNGVDEMQFTKQDLHEEVARQRKILFEEGDAKVMFDYFKRMVDENSNFFYTYRVDEEGRLQDVLWVDARSRAAYEEFGDVVCIDSTYLTNEYKLPFCNFVGVNHHGQTILFGCALVSRETAETFEWVFSNWLRCMGEKEPVGILTDQDAAMRKALRVTMNGATHRWCIWHITQKFAKRLGKLPNYHELHDDLERAIYDSLDVEEFESNWEVVIKKHNVEDDEWLQGLYEERYMWVPVFLRHLFWAGMKTTQRVESIHRFFDGYLSKHTLLSEFVERYVDALEVRCSSEKRANDNNDRYVRQVYSAFPAELIFQKIYTDAKFKEVQRECSRVIYVSGIQRKQISESVTEHVVEDRVWYKPKNSRKEKPSKRKKEYKVVFDNSTKEVSCDCHLFDCNGIVCRHMIKVYEMSNFYDIPEKYILRRWRKDVIRKHTRVKVVYHDPSKTEEVCRYDKMMVRFGSVCSKAAFYAESATIVMQALQVLEVQVDEKIGQIKKKAASGVVGTPASVNSDKAAEGSSRSDVQVPPKDPPLPKRPAHRTTDSRYKSCLEKPKKVAKTMQSNPGSSGTNQATHFQQPSYSIQGTPQPNWLSYNPHFMGGIQLLDTDDSIGYFTSLLSGGIPHVQRSPQIFPQLRGSYLPPCSPFPYPISPTTAASSQGTPIPVLPRPRPPRTPPPHPPQLH